MTTRGQLIYPSFTELGLLIPQICAVDSCNQVSDFLIFIIFDYFLLALYRITLF